MVKAVVVVLEGRETAEGRAENETRVRIGQVQELEPGQHRNPPQQGGGQKRGQAEGVVVLTAHGGGEQAGAEKKEQQIQRHQHHARDLPLRHRPQHHGDGQRRGHGHDRVNGLERSRNQLSEHHVVTFQVRQEEQAEGALSFFLAHAIAGGQQAGQRGVSEQEDGQDFEHDGAVLRAGAAGGQQNPGGDGPSDDGHRQAAPVRAAPPRHHAQFALHDRQKGHTAAIVPLSPPQARP